MKIGKRLHRYASLPARCFRVSRKLTIHLSSKHFSKFGITQVQLALQLFPCAGQIHAVLEMIEVSRNGCLRAIVKL